MKKAIVLAIVMSASALAYAQCPGGSCSAPQGYPNQPMGGQPGYSPEGYPIVTYPNGSAPQGYPQGNYYQQDGYQQQGNYPQGSYPQQGGGYGMTQDNFATPQDRDLGKNIRRAIGENPNIVLYVNSGNVTLQGTARSEKERSKIEDMVRRVKGVRNINNQIMVGG